jgi:hypothetical protein
MPRSSLLPIPPPPIALDDLDLGMIRQPRIEGGNLAIGQVRQALAVLRKVV